MLKQIFANLIKVVMGWFRSPKEDDRKGYQQVVSTATATTEPVKAYKGQLLRRLHRALNDTLQLNVRGEKPCKICGQLMLVTPLQVAYYHKACRYLRHNKGLKTV